MNESILDEGAVSEIENRANVASKGPWSQSALASAYIVGRHTDDFPVVCAFAEYEKDGTLYLEFANAKNNMGFLAHAREDIPALCATVKHLRWQVGLCEKAFELDGALRLSEVGDLNALQVVRKMVDLQSQLEQLRTIAGGALRFRVEMNGACNHDEYMTKLCTQCEIRAALEKL